MSAGTARAKAWLVERAIALRIVPAALFTPANPVKLPGRAPHGAE